MLNVKINKSLCAMAVIGVFAMGINVAEGGRGQEGKGAVANRSSAEGARPQSSQAARENPVPIQIAGYSAGEYVGNSAKGKSEESLPVAQNGKIIFKMEDFLNKPEILCREVLDIHIWGEDGEPCIMPTNELNALLLFCNDGSRRIFPNGSMIKKIGCVTFEKCLIDDEGMVLLAKQIELNNLTIDSLSFNHVSIKEEFIKNFLTAFKKNTTLKNLGLYDVGIPDIGGRVIVDVLKTNTKLKWLLFGPKDTSLESFIKLSQEIKVGISWVLDEEYNVSIHAERNGKNLCIKNMGENMPFYLESMLDSGMASEYLSFENCIIPAKVMQLLCEDISFKGLSFKNCTISPESLSEISHLKTEKLWLTDKTIKNGDLPKILDLEVLKKNKTWRFLSLENNEISPEDVSSLSLWLNGNMDLEKLIISGNSLGEAGAISIAKSIVAKNSALKAVWMCNVGLDENGRKECIKLLETREPSVEIYLEEKSSGDQFVFEGIISEKAIEELKTNKNLKQVHFHNVEMTDETWRAITEVLKGTNETLEWVVFGPKDTSPENLIELSKKTKVGISWDLDEEHNVSIHIRSNGKGLHIVNTTDDISSTLGRMLDLDMASEYLWFENCIISAKVIQLLCRYNFFTVGFRSCKILDPDKSLSEFSNLKAKVLHLEKGTINKGNLPTVLEALKENKALKLLGLERNDLTNTDMKPLFEALETNIPLEVLAISGNPIGKSGLETLFESIVKNSALKRIGAEDIGIEEKDREECVKLLEARETPLEIYWEKSSSPTVISGTKKAVEPVAQSTSERKEPPEACVDDHLVFKYNQINEETIKGLSEKLRTTIVSLRIEACTISDSVMKSVAEALKESESLKEIAFRDCRITHKGFENLSKALEVNETLELLCLDNGSIDEAGLDIISKGLKLNHGVKQLFLSNNGLKDVGPLSGVLRENGTLEVLNISKNNVRYLGMTTLIHSALKIKEIYAIDVGVKENKRSTLTKELGKREPPLKVHWE